MHSGKKRAVNPIKKFMPSTNQVFLGGVILLYLYTLLEGDSLPFFLFRSLGFVLVFAWLWTAEIYSGLRYGTGMEVERSQVGEIFQINISLSNTIRFYIPWLEVSVDIPPEFELVYGRKGYVFSLSGREQRTSTFQVRCLKRGYYQIGSAKIRLGDVFGIFVRERLLKAQRMLIVYPKIVPLERVNLPSLRNLGSKVTVKSSDEDLTGPTGVRKYAYADPLNRIHWRATARTGQLQVKEYDLHTAAEVGIFLDLTAQAYNNLPDQVLETAVTTAASIANHCFNKRVRYGLVSNGVNLFVQPPSRDTGQLLQSMEHLAVANTGGGYSFSRTVLLESRNFIQGTTLLFITPQIDAELAGILDVLKQRGYRLAIAQVGPGIALPAFPYSVTCFTGLSEENLAQVVGGEVRAAEYKPWFG